MATMYGYRGIVQHEYQVAEEDDELKNARHSTVDPFGSTVALVGGKLVRINRYTKEKEVLAEQLFTACHVSAEILSTGPHYMVCVLLKDEVHVFDQNGKTVGIIGGTGREDGRLRGPRSTAANEFGNVLVLDSGNNRVSEFTPGGYFIRHVLTVKDGLVAPITMFCENGRLVVVCKGDKYIQA